ncbi:hypothetical protein Sjap_001108 [Stephania japonica]|uniref:PHD finger protein ALFIN-LIKE n=1 Tax=Stephania japonica TaxID=461633 RepID=A0AAP0KJC7_9MAGN
MASLPPRDVDSQVFNDFCCRRYALIEALTTDLDQFLDICDPEKGVLCLSANAAKMSWDVTCPPPELDMTPPELPQPAPGVFFKREGKPVSYKQEAMPLSEWLLKIAIQCDTWLKSVASHRGAHWDTSARQGLLQFHSL